MNYYNEFDPAAATWLRELIAAKLIPQGEVDTRSIKDVRADDLRGFTQCHFFAGIGGWSRALQLAGWPKDRPVWTGSCPCQCFSLAGAGKGAEDERDLWPVFFELVKACRPEYVFGEQVEAAIKHGWLDRVCANMEREKYTVGAIVLGAHSSGAPHLRQRLYWGAARLAEDSASIRCGGRNNADSAGQGWQQESRNVGKLQDGFEGPCDFDCVGNSEGNDKFWNSERRSCEIETGRSSRNISMADNREQGLEGYREFRKKQIQEGRQGEKRHSCTSSISSFSPWSDFGLVYCRDNKVRRVPAESLLQCVADGLSEGVDEGRDCCVLEAERGFPLCKKEEEIGRTMLLKGYGNAIIPQVAAEFIKAFEEEAK